MTDMELELGARVVDAWRFEHSIIRWCGGAEYYGHRLLKLWAEDCFRWWWRHV